MSGLTEAEATQEGGDTTDLVQISFTHDQQIQEFSDGLMKQVRHLQDQLKMKDDMIEDMK